MAGNNNVGGKSPNSLEAATLAAAATFQGTIEQVDSFGRVGVAIHSTNATDGTLTIQVSHDGSIWSEIPRTVADTRFANPVMWNIVEKYFKIKYVNGSTEADDFSIQTQYSSNADILLGHPLNETLIDEMTAIITRAVAVGQDEAGVYRNAGMVNSSGKTSSYVAMGFTNTETIHLDVGTAVTLVAYMLIDLSNTAVWKHTNTGEIVIEYIIIEVDPDTNFLGEIKIGYLTNVDGTNGDFNQLIDIDMARKSGLFSEVIDFGSHGMHCTDDHHFGPKIANSTLFQTDVNLGGPDDPGTLTYPSGNGDLVMIIDGDGSNTVDVSITIGYETVAAE